MTRRCNFDPPHKPLCFTNEQFPAPLLVPTVSSSQTSPCNGRSVQRIHGRGVTLIEVLIVVTILGLISAAIAIAVIPTGDRARRDLAEQNARALRAAALQWRSTIARAGCPSVMQLRQDRGLDRSAKTEDPWGKPYKIACDDDEIYVSSAGRDGKEGSADDIVEPGREAETR